MAEISSLLRGALLALFVGLIISAVQIAGKTNVPLARLLLAVSWVIGVVGVWSNAPDPYKTTITIAAGVLFGVGLILLGWWFGTPERPNLKKSQIICLAVESAPADAESERDCFLTMSVQVENTGADVTILDFDCVVSYRGSTSETQRIYKLARYEQFCGYEPSDDSDPKRKEVWEYLFDFPADALVTKSRPVRGWLRFHARSLPDKALRTETRLSNEVLIELYAVSGAGKNRRRYLVYDGGDPDDECGPIRTIPKRRILVA